MSVLECKISLKSKKFIVVQVLSYKSHPGFEIDKIPKLDIAIINTEPIEEPGFVPACLNRDFDESLIGKIGTILSWAPQPKNNESYEAELLSAMMSVGINSICEKSIGVRVPSHSFCVHQSVNNAWLCRGDSGGSFMILENGRWYLKGVVSSGSDDCIGGNSVIFTKVREFYNFITL